MASSLNLDANQRNQLYNNDISKLYAQKLKDREGRKWEFMKANDNRQLKILAISGSSGAVTGAIIGGTVGGLCGTPGGPIGVGGGIVIGGLIGGAIGLSIATGVCCYEYQKWKNTDEGREMGGLILPFLAEDPALSSCFCPISQDIAMDAVRTPSGGLYERKSVEKWIDEKGTDPITHTPLTKDQLKTCHKTIGTITKTLVKNLDEDMQKEIPQGVRNGLMKLKKGMEEQRNAVFTKETVNLQALQKLKKITNEELSARMKTLTETLY